MAKIIDNRKLSVQNKKPIKFIKALRGLKFVNIFQDPSNFQFIQLIDVGYVDDMDLIKAWHCEDDEWNGSAMLYLGYWNDGIV